MKQGVLRVTYELIEDLFKFPKDCNIIGISQDEPNKLRRSFGIVITGPKLPETEEGHTLTWFNSIDDIKDVEELDPVT